MVLKQILNASDAGTSRGFGRVVQKYGDYLATSANSTSAWNAPGKVYVFHFNGTSWVEEDSFCRILHLVPIILAYLSQWMRVFC